MKVNARRISVTAVAYVCLLFGAFCAGPVAANHAEGHIDTPTSHERHQGQAAAGKTKDSPALSEASKAYDDAMQKMHREMAIPYTNDVDVDFVRGMIPHHQGAIEQAQILVKYSKNPRLRLLAGGIIAAQKREIKFMKHWLEQHEKGIKSNDMPVWLRSNPAALDEAKSPPRSNQ